MRRSRRCVDRERQRDNFRRPALGERDVLDNPEMAVDDAKFPFEIVAAPCAKDDKQLRFFFEKS